MFTFPFGFNGNQGNPNFVTTLYTGNGSTQSIITDISADLIWLKKRASGSVIANHLYDTLRGANNSIYSDSTAGNQLLTDHLTSININGFDVGVSANVNEAGNTYVAWSFRKALGFFDIVSYTGDGVSNRSVPHNLNTNVGCIFIKNISTSSDWIVGHRALNNEVNSWSFELNLNNDTSQSSSSNLGTPTSSNFIVGSSLEVNLNTNQYIAYLFGHEPSSTGRVYCGRFTTDISGSATINIGWKPRWLLSKDRANTSGVNTDWDITDAERGVGRVLKANKSALEQISGTPTYTFTDTGFNITNANASTESIYIAIR